MAFRGEMCQIGRYLPLGVNARSQTLRRRRCRAGSRVIWTDDLASLVETWSYQVDLGHLERGP